MKGMNYGYHSFRLTLSNLSENTGVAENFDAQIIGKKVDLMTYFIYSKIHSMGL